MSRKQQRELTPTVEEAKEWYVEGYVDDDGLDELLDEAVERREQRRGDVPDCDYCGEPLNGFWAITSHGRYHSSCLDQKQQERWATPGRLLLIALAITSFCLLVVFLAPAPDPNGAVPLVAGAV
jgi:hypothetical protein